MLFDCDKYLRSCFLNFRLVVYNKNDTFPECRNTGQGPRQTILCYIKCIRITVPQIRSSNVAFILSISVLDIAGYVMSGIVNRNLQFELDWLQSLKHFLSLYTIFINVSSCKSILYTCS